MENLSVLPCRDLNTPFFYLLNVRPRSVATRPVLRPVAEISYLTPPLKGDSGGQR